MRISRTRPLVRPPRTRTIAGDEEVRAVAGTLVVVATPIGNLDDLSPRAARLLEILPSDVDVLWQTGDTDVTHLGITGHRALPERELTAAIRDAGRRTARAPAVRREADRRRDGPQKAAHRRAAGRRRADRTQAAHPRA
jgi:hypothetical protein